MYQQSKTDRHTRGILPSRRLQLIISGPTLDWGGPVETWVPCTVDVVLSGEAGVIHVERRGTIPSGSTATAIRLLINSGYQYPKFSPHALGHGHNSDVKLLCSRCKSLKHLTLRLFRCKYSLGKNNTTEPNFVHTFRIAAVTQQQRTVTTERLGQ